MKTTELKQTQESNQALKDVPFFHVRNLAVRLISLPGIAEGSGGELGTSGFGTFRVLRTPSGSDVANGWTVVLSIF